MIALLVIFGAFGLFLAAEAQVAPMTRTTVGAAGFLMLLLALATLRAGPRAFERWGADVALGACGGLIAASTAVMETAQGQMSEGLLLLVIGVLSAAFRPRRRMWAVLAWMLAVYTAAWLVHPVLTGVVNLAMVEGVIVGVCLMVSNQATRLRGQALTDPLTGLLNRRGLESQAVIAEAVARRATLSMTVCILDLDGFKAFNDVHGHLAGDVLLADLADCWRRELREGDLLARFGGDEFVLVLPGATVNEIDSLMTRLTQSHGARWSRGCAAWEPGEPLHAALGRADQALYEAKTVRMSDEPG